MGIKSESPSTAQVAAKPEQSEGKNAIDSVVGTYKPEGDDAVGFTPVKNPSPMTGLTKPS